MEYGEANEEGERARIHTFLGQHRSQEIERWIAAHQEGEVSPEDVTWAEGKIGELDARIGRIADVNNFTDMPPELRSQTLQRYRGYRASLAGIIERAGGSVADSFSEEGQAAFGEFEALRQRVSASEREAASARAEVVRFRRRWGQEASESLADGQLPADAQARTGSMWSSAETAYQGAMTARREAETRYNESLRDPSERGEDRQRTALRSATGSYEQALAAFEEATEQMDALADVYRPYRVDPDQRQSGATAEADESATGSERDESQRDASQRDGGERTESRERPRRRPQPREGGQRASSPEAAGTSPTEQARQSEREQEPEQQPEQSSYRFQISRQRLGRLITVVNGGTDVERQRISLEHGLVVQTLGGFAGAFERMPGGDAAVGGLELYALRLRVVEPASSSYTHLVTTCVGRSGEEITFRVANAEGETFASSAVRAPEIE
jgi:hypothetical protein